MYSMAVVRYKFLYLVIYKSGDQNEVLLTTTSISTDMSLTATDMSLISTAMSLTNNDMSLTSTDMSLTNTVTSLTTTSKSSYMWSIITLGLV